MKNVFILISIAIIAMSFPNGNLAFAANVKKIDYVIVYSTTESNTKNTFTYDAWGNNTYKLGQVFSNSIWVDKSRTNTTYNSEGLHTFSSSENYVNGNWSPNLQGNYTWNAAKQLLSYTIEIYSYGVWYPRNKQINTYDEEGKQLTYHSIGYSSGQIMTSIKRTDTYGPNKLIASRLSEMIYGGNESKSKFTYKYNDKNQLISYLTENESNGTPGTNYQITLEYNDNGDETLELAEQYSGTNLIPYRRRIKTYDINHNLLTLIEEYWGTDKYQSSMKEEYTYNEQGKKISYFYTSYSNGVISLERGESFKYDIKGNEIEWKSQEKVAGEWTDKDRRATQYDSDGNYTTINYETFASGKWNSKNMSNFNLIDPNKKILDVYQGYKVEVFYKNITEVDEERISNNFTISPNPATDFIEVNYDKSFCDHEVDPKGMQKSKIEIYNMLGECVLSVETQNFVSLQRINVSGLTEGIYFVRIGNSYMKFVKI